MYIVKNAFYSIARSKARNVLIGIIVLVIATSACIGLSIRQASENTRAKALSEMIITASVTYDRIAMMQEMGGNRQPDEKPQDGGFDRDKFFDAMGEASALTVEEYKQYASASTVDDFYYTLTAYFNGTDDFLPVTDEEETETTTQTNQYEMDFHGDRPGDMGGGNMGGMAFSTGDFTLVGFSSDNSMTDFIEGNATILDGGAMFSEGTEDYVCVISEELALFNDLAVGDTIVVTNPKLEDESYTLEISGIYTSSTNNDMSMSMFSKSQDPANRIYMSADALQLILNDSESNNQTVTDSTTGRESESKITATVDAKYVFANPDDYYTFEKEVYTLGLDEAYDVSSTDVKAFENRLAPLDTLGTMAGWFLLVILIIGGVILVVLNIFNVRERKYEVGVLTAMGMKKHKVAAQFILEILVVTMIAVIIGTGVGAVSSVPVTNALLANQVENETHQQEQVDTSFGRPGNMDSNHMMQEGNIPPDMPSDMPDNNRSGKGGPFENMMAGATEYISEVDSAMNLTVVFQMMGVGLLLTLIASAASVLFIMRYDPLRILSNRD